MSDEITRSVVGGDAAPPDAPMDDASRGVPEPPALDSNGGIVEHPTHYVADPSPLTGGWRAETADGELQPHEYGARTQRGSDRAGLPA